MDLQQFTKYYKNMIDLNEHFLIKQKEFMVQLQTFTTSDYELKTNSFDNY